MMTWYVTVNNEVFLVTAETTEMAKHLLELEQQVYVSSTDLKPVKTSSRWSRKVATETHSLQAAPITVSPTFHPHARP